MKKTIKTMNQKCPVCQYEFEERTYYNNDEAYRHEVTKGKKEFIRKQFCYHEIPLYYSIACPNCGVHLERNICENITITNE